MTVVAPQLQVSRAHLARAAATAARSWPRGLDGWTVVLLSSPATRGQTKPLALATGAARRGLTQVGVLDSSAFASLHPGYYVVFSGVYGAAGDARVALETGQSPRLRRRLRAPGRAVIGSVSRLFES